MTRAPFAEPSSSTSALTMTAREALAEALEAVDDVLRYSTGVMVDMESPIFTAARERLAQLPPYPAETVEKIAGAIVEDDFPFARRNAIAVLDALGKT